MKKTLSWQHSIFIAIIAILLAPSMDYTKPNLVVLMVLLLAVFVYDIASSLMQYSIFKQNEKYIKSLREELNKSYRYIHEYFAKISKEYPDNSYDIAAATYKLLMNNTDMLENEFEVYITKGAVKDFPHPHYWLTIFSFEDPEHLHPFIIDVNALRYEADRDTPFKEVLRNYKMKILSETDKEYKNYRPYSFMEYMESTIRCIKIGTQSRPVYVSTFTDKDISDLDWSEINKRYKQRIKANINHYTRKKLSN